MRKYNLQPDLHYSLYTGRTQNDLQVMVKHYEFSAIAILFTLDGDLVELKQKFIEENDIEKLNVFRQTELIRNTLHNLVAEVGLQQLQPIQIKEFFLDQYEIGVKELPWDLDEFVKSPSAYAEREKIALEEEVSSWRDSRRFVFHWGNDFWCDADGFITAS